MSEKISLSHASQFPFLPVTGKQSVFVLLELNAKEIKQEKRSPINLSLVLDRSGSMDGAPLEYCKEASKFVVNQLSGQDLFNLIVFDDQVDTIIEPQAVQHKDRLKNQIDRIETGGTTNLSGGLIEGCRNILKQKTKEYVNRVILLSDGQANEGITDRDKLTKVAEDYHAAGAVITTMGVSDYFDEELMEGIADAGKGNFHFISKVEEIPDIFAKELEGLLSVLAQNVSLKLTPKKGVTLTNILGYSHKKKDDGVVLSLGDMYAGETKSVLVECEVAAQAEGIADLFEVEWSFVDVTDGIKDYTYRYNVPIEFTADLDKLAEAPDKTVEKQIQITKSAQLLEQALYLFDNGDIDEGKELLYSNALKMERVAKENGDIELMEESAIIMSQLENFDYNANSRKTLHAEKYRQMKRRKK